MALILLGCSAAHSTSAITTYSWGNVTTQPLKRDLSAPFRTRIRILYGSWTGVLAIKLKGEGRMWILVGRRKSWMEVSFVLSYSLRNFSLSLIISQIHYLILLKFSHTIHGNRKGSEDYSKKRSVSLLRRPQTVASQHPLNFQLNNLVKLSKLENESRRRLSLPISILVARDTRQNPYYTELLVD